jgi:hypothetical protein
MARTNSKNRFTVAFLHPCASFASVMRSISARLMTVKSLPPKNESSQRSFVTSSLAVALCDCSFNHLTAASFHVRRGFSPNFEIRHNSDFSRS